MNICSLHRKTEGDLITDIFQAIKSCKFERKKYVEIAELIA